MVTCVYWDKTPTTKYPNLTMAHQLFLQQITIALGMEESELLYHHSLMTLTPNPSLMLSNSRKWLNNCYPWQWQEHLPFLHGCIQWLPHPQQHNNHCLTLPVHVFPSSGFLVGNVEYSTISKWYNSNTNVQHFTTRSKFFATLVIFHVVQKWCCGIEIKKWHAKKYALHIRILLVLF